MRQAERKRRVMVELEAHPFEPGPWISGGNRQTVLGAALRKCPPTGASLERWETPDDDFLRLHILEGEPAAPVVVILHGLEGGADSEYVVGFTHLLAAQGWTAVTMEQRSCGGEMNRARRLYHLGVTDDLDGVVRTAVERWPGRPIFLAGFSLGGNQIANWLAELGERVPEAVRAAAAVSVPYDTVLSEPCLERAFHGLYVKNFMRTLIPKALAKERQYPGCIDSQAVSQATSFTDFDNHVTAPLHGFRDARDYWISTSCGQHLGAVRRPLLLLSAADDPFNPAETFPSAVARDSAYLHPLLTEHGGHIGFVLGWAWKPEYWGDAQLLRFFSAYRSD